MTHVALKEKVAQELGVAWASAVRADSGDSVGHYYMHLCLAHLAESIERHGFLQHGNDEVLEKGNRDVKHFRDMSFKEGNSAANKLPQTQKRNRK
eukprot:6136185-Pleurochrysis_carterae.AAC.2